MRPEVGGEILLQGVTYLRKILRIFVPERGSNRRVWAGTMSTGHPENLLNLTDLAL